MHIDNKEKCILILEEEPTEGLNNMALTAEAKHPNNFAQSGKRFVLNLHYDGSNSFLFANATKVYQFKPKKLEIKDYALCLRNVSKDFRINNVKKTGLKEVVKFFSVDFNPIDTNDILDIHKYLMIKTRYKIILGLIKKIIIGLLTGLVNGSIHTKCGLLSNQKCDI